MRTPHRSAARPPLHTGREGKGREGKGREGKGREGKGREGKGREGKGREGKGREGKGREGKGREGKGREGKRREVKGRPGQHQLHKKPCIILLARHRARGAAMQLSVLLPVPSIVLNNRHQAISGLQASHGHHSNVHGHDMRCHDPHSRL